MNPRLLLAALAFAAIARAGEPAIRVTTNVPYLEAYRTEKLDLYLPPATATKPTPAIVWIHGGGWSGGTKNEERAKEICGTFAKAGYVAVSIDYRLGTGAWPQCILDAKNAVRFLRAHAAEYGVDPARIAVAGGSAGGHLALMVGFTAGDPALTPRAPYPEVKDDVRCVIDMYGPTDIADRRQTAPDGSPLPTAKLASSSLKIFGAESAESPVLRQASPYYRVAKNVPPVLILHGRADTTVDYLQSQKLDRALTEAGVPHEFLLIDGIGHTFDLERWRKKPLPQDLRPVVLAFLAKHLGEPAK